MWVVRVQFACSLIRIKCILNLIIAWFIQCTQIVPNFADVWIKSYSAAVSVQCVTILHESARQCQRLKIRAELGGVPPTMGELGEAPSHLVNLVIQDANGTPKCRIACVAIDCLLVSFVSLVVILFCHVAPAEQIPRLGICAVSLQRAGQVGNRCVLIGKGSVLLMIEPSELLEHFGVFRVFC